MTFQYHNPIQFHFGPDTLEKTPELCKGLCSEWKP